MIFLHYVLIHRHREHRDVYSMGPNSNNSGQNKLKEPAGSKSHNTAFTHAYNVNINMPGLWRGITTVIHTLLTLKTLVIVSNTKEGLVRQYLNICSECFRLRLDREGTDIKARRK